MDHKSKMEKKPMRTGYGIAALALVAIGSGAQAETASLWRVNGAVSGRTFTLDCQLVRGGGTCTDATPGGKTHPLASFADANGQVNWSFKTRVALISVTLAFSGRVSGDRMNGTMTAAGRSGTFTAMRR